MVGFLFIYLFICKRICTKNCRIGPKAKKSRNKQNRPDFKNILLKCKETNNLVPPIYSITSYPCQPLSASLCVSEGHLCYFGAVIATKNLQRLKGCVSYFKLLREQLYYKDRFSEYADRQLSLDLLSLSLSISFLDP